MPHTDSARSNQDVPHVIRLGSMVAHHKPAFEHPGSSHMLLIFGFCAVAGSLYEGRLRRRISAPDTSPLPVLDTSWNTLLLLRKMGMRLFFV